MPITYRHTFLVTEMIIFYLCMYLFYLPYIFGFCPQFLVHSSPNPQNFLSVKGNKGVFCHINECGFWTPPKRKYWLSGGPTM